MKMPREQPGLLITRPLPVLVLDRAESSCDVVLRHDETGTDLRRGIGGIRKDELARKARLPATTLRRVGCSPVPVLDTLSDQPRHAAFDAAYRYR